MFLVITVTSEIEEILRTFETDHMLLGYVVLLPVVSLCITCIEYDRSKKLSNLLEHIGIDSDVLILYER